MCYTNGENCGRKKKEENGRHVTVSFKSVHEVKLLSILAEQWCVFVHAVQQ